MFSEIFSKIIRPIPQQRTSLAKAGAKVHTLSLTAKQNRHFFMLKNIFFRK